MASQTVSPREAAIARTKLKAMEPEKDPYEGLHEFLSGMSDGLSGRPYRGSEGSSDASVDDYFRAVYRGYMEEAWRDYQRGDRPGWTFSAPQKVWEFHDFAPGFRSSNLYCRTCNFSFGVGLHNPR